jgi:hypothetical protein
MPSPSAAFGVGGHDGRSVSLAGENGRLVAAVPSKGRMAQASLELCAAAGLNFEAGERALHVPCANAPVDLLLVRPHANQILPTGGLARGGGGLWPEVFLKPVQVVRATAEGLGSVRPTIVALAALEGLPLHAAAADARFSLAR